MRLATLSLVLLVACDKGAAPSAPMVPATELRPGEVVDAGDAGHDAAIGTDAAPNDDDDGGAERAECIAKAAQTLKMPTMDGCVKKCGELPAKPPPRCMTREACKRRCYGVFGPM